MPRPQAELVDDSGLQPPEVQHTPTAVAGKILPPKASSVFCTLTGLRTKFSSDCKGVWVMQQHAATAQSASTHAALAMTLPEAASQGLQSPLA